MTDTFNEILHTIKNNPLRTFLTSLAVAWGIFMLVLLLGSGNGLENGVRAEFADNASNAIWVHAGQTSVPHEGLQPGRYIKFTNKDYEEIKNTIPHIQAISAEFWIWNGNTVSYKSESNSYTLRAVHPDYQYVEFREMLSGRFLNETDIADSRRVAVIGSAVRDGLFVDGTDPIGENIIINGNAFTVIGVFKDKLNTFSSGRIYLPVSTAQKLISGSNTINEIMLTTDFHTAEENEMVAEAIRALLARNHNFSMKDQRAINVNNSLKQFEMFNQLFLVISGFIWFVGSGTIIAGIVGVSNIMMVVVKERTKEIGIRKAIGATPWNITSQIVIEAVLITAASGYLGMLAGIGLLELVSASIPEETKFFKDPQVDLGIAITATIVLVLAGALAGFFPARHAAAIKPIHALRDE